MIRINNLSKYFGDKKVFSSINLTIKSSNIVLIHGISGSGKTTLLNMIAGLESISDGEVLIDQQKVNFQDLALFKDQIYYSTVENDLIINSRVIDNLLLISSDKEQINSLLTELHLEKYKKKKIRKLSKGEKERISLIKALLAKQNILLFDEPTANLDKENAILFIKALNKYLNNRIVIICSHDYQLLQDYVDEVYKLENGNLIKEETINKYNDEKVVIKLKSPQKSRILSKLALTKIFRRKVFLGFNIFFLFLFLSCIYFAIAYATVDVDSYLTVYISDNVDDEGFVPLGLSLDLYEGSIAKKLSEDHGVFFSYVNGISTRDPKIPDLDSVVNYSNISISVLDFTGNIGFSDEFDYQYADYFVPVVINSFQKTFIESYFNMTVEINTVIPYVTYYVNKGMVVANIVDVNVEKANLRDAFNYYPVLTKFEYIEDVIRYSMSFSLDEYNDLRTLYTNTYQDFELNLPIFNHVYPFSYLEYNNIDYTLFNGNEFDDNDFLLTVADYDKLTAYIDKYPEVQIILDFLFECDLFKDTKHPGLSGTYSLNGTYEGDDDGVIIVSDAIFDKIIQNIYDGYLYPTSTYGAAYLPKNFLLNNIYLLSNNNLTNVYDDYDLSLLRDTINAFDAKRNMFSIFSYILLGLFILLFSIHYLLVFIDIRRDCSILLLNGYNKKDIYKLILIFFSIIFAFGFILWVCFTPLFNYIVQIFDHIWTYYISTNIVLSIFVPLFIVIGLVLIYSLSSLLIKKEKMFDIIKNT